MDAKELLQWVEHQLNVLNDYGFNHYDVLFFSDDDIEMDSDLRRGDYEAYESGLFGRDYELLWSQKFQGGGWAGEPFIKSNFIPI